MSGQVPSPPAKRRINPQKGTLGKALSGSWAGTDPTATRGTFRTGLSRHRVAEQEELIRFSSLS